MDRLGFTPTEKAGNRKKLKNSPKITISIFKAKITIFETKVASTTHNFRVTHKAEN